MSVDHYTPAREQAAACRAGRISARELLELHLARIERVNPRVNALVSVDAERATEIARAADERQARGKSLGPLHGLPFAVKDTHYLTGWPTTFGSTIRADFVAAHDDLHVARILAAGAVPVAKSNVPEFAAGSHTFNAVFGTTLNPYDLTRSAGGSSGGAAAALATGMVALADGSDMGGSLRNPASFNNVVGLRPGFGRVPTWPSWNIFEPLSVAGPLARDVEVRLVRLDARPRVGEHVGLRGDDRRNVGIHLEGAAQVDRQGHPQTGNRRSRQRRRERVARHLRRRRHPVVGAGDHRQQQGEVLDVAGQRAGDADRLEDVPGGPDGHPPESGAQADDVVERGGVA